MPAYDYALIRVVPRVHLGGGDPAGVILQCRQRRYLAIGWAQPPEDLAARWSSLPLLPRYLAAMAAAASGEGPIGRYPPSERFHWLTATRSTVLQPSPVHTGLTEDPEATLAHLTRELRPR
jgi:hypothetical protein